GPGSAGAGPASAAPGGAAARGDQGLLHTTGPYAPRDFRETARVHRDGRHEGGEAGKPESDAWAPRVPGQRGRG
ncbi:hypothetical protein AN218_19080, partial [Streptomyces nanshensis]